MTTWPQHYLLFGHGLGVSFLFAALPIVTLLTVLAILRKPAWLAGLSGLGVALALAVLAYGMPLPLALSAAASGAAFGLFPILWIIFWAIALFRLTVETGRFAIIRNSIGRLTPDPRLQALLIAFAFSGFLEGSAGFGTPVAIAATMLIGLGFSPFSASAICLLANTAPVAFGSVGIPVFTLAGTTGLSPRSLSAAVGALCAPMSFLIPVYLTVAIGGLAATRGIWLPLLLAGGVCASVQFAVSTWLGPPLTDILAGIATMTAIVLYLRLKDRVPHVSPLRHGLSAAILQRFAHFGASSEHDTVAPLPLEARIIPAYPFRTVLGAWMPYILLILCVQLWSLPAVAVVLDRVTLHISWPLLHNVVLKMSPVVARPTPYPAIFTLNWLSASGTALMLATLLSAALLRLSPLRFLRVLGGTARQLALPALIIATVLALAFLMNFSGATATLGLAFAATGSLFPFFSALLGWVGVFLTGSDTSANALFGNLQVVTANRLGFSPVLMAAANSAGGVMGKMISLQTIAIAAASTGLSPEGQSRLFRFTLRHSIVLASAVGCLALLYAHLAHFR